MEAVIPTRNDYQHLPKILSVLKSCTGISKVYVVDNNSLPEISSQIWAICQRNPEAEYCFCEAVGKGNAIAVGIRASTEDVLFLDGDVENLSESMISSLLSKFSEGYALVKANIRRKNGQSNSAFVLNKLKKLLPSLNVQRPTCGIYCVKREVLNKIKIPPSWSVDLSILVQAHLFGFSIGEIDIGEIKDKPRSEESLAESKIVLQKELAFVEVMLHG